jgi:hypothetical protein
MPGPTNIITDTELSGLLKNVYSQFREKVQNLVTPLLAQLQKGKAGGPRNMRWGGNDVFFDVVTGRPSGAVFSQSGYFPEDTFASEAQGRVRVTRAYVTRQIDGLAFVGTTSKEAAYTSIAKKTMEEIKDASTLLMQQALHNKPDGVVALAGTTTGTTTFNVISPYGIADTTNNNQGALLLAVGDSIAVLSGSSGTTIKGKARITAITAPVLATGSSTLTVTPALGSASASGDRIVKLSNNASETYPSDTSAFAMNGLINITNRDGSTFNTLHGIDGSTTAIWNSTRMVAGTDTPDTTQPTESDIWDLIQRINGRSGKDAMARPQDFLLITTPGIGKKLMESMVGQRRFTGSEFATTIKGGYKAIEVCGIPLVMDYYVPLGTIYLLHLPSLAWVDAKDWGFVEFEGAGPWRWMPSRDAFETTYGYYGNLACLARNAHGSIQGYVDTSKYSHLS